MKLNYDLETPFSPKDIDHPLMEYPRPHFRRDSYLNLNGIYNFEINQTGGIPKSFTEEILVPYPVESSLSRIKRRITDKDYLIYSKEFYVEESFIKDKTILHIDAVDQVADIYINGVKVGHHEGSYLPFIKEVFNSFSLFNSLISFSYSSIFLLSTFIFSFSFSSSRISSSSKNLSISFIIS